MATWHPIQSNFSSGELSPQFNAQQDSPLYSRGLQQCRNAIPLSQGVATSRPGTKYIMTVDGDPTDARIIPVDINSSVYGVAVLGGGSVRVLASDSFTADQQLISNPDFREGLSGWSTQKDTSAPIKKIEAENGKVRLAGDGMARTDTLSVSQTVAIPDNASDNAVLRVTFLSGDSSPDFCDAFVEVKDTNNSLIKYKEEALEDGKRWRYYYTIPNTAGVVDQTVQVRVGFRSVGPVEIFGLIYDTRQELYIEEVTVTAIGVPGKSSPVLPIPYSDDELADLQYVMSPYSISTVIVHPKHHPQELAFYIDQWVFRPITFSAVGGTEPDWDAVKGFPAAVGAYQGRVMFANTTAQPQSVWGSRSGDWYDINLPGTTTPSSPVWFTLTERAAIQWVHGHKTLLLGTTSNEYEVSSQSGVLQAGDIHANIQSSYGSSNIQPLGLGELVMSTSGNRKVARGLSLSRNIMGWEADNLNWSAGHILDPGARRVANSRDPYRVAWVPLRSGDLAGLSFEPSQQIKGWHKHTTQGEFIDAVNVVSTLSESTFFLVKRYIQDETKIMMESIDAIYSDADVNYVDSYTKKIFGDPVSEVTGLGHLAGEVVSVTVDGAVHPDTPVVGQTLTLEWPGREIVVGLPYKVTIETLPAYSPTQVGGLGARKHWAEIGVRLVDSPHPLINGVRVEERHPETPMGEPEEGTTGQITTANRGWDEYGRILIEQDLPLPLVLAGVFGKLSVEDL